MWEDVAAEAPVIIDYTSTIMPPPATGSILCTTTAIVHRTSPKSDLTDLYKTIVIDSPIGCGRQNAPPGPANPRISRALSDMQLHLEVTGFASGASRGKMYLKRICRLTHCLNLLKHTGKRTHDGQLAQMQHRGMGAGYNVTWFRCPGCKLGPTTLAKALDYTNWECDGLDDQTGRTTHNDNKTNSACPRQGDFLKFRKFSMRPMPSQKIKSRA
jgi:hypothetical protein